MSEGRVRALDSWLLGATEADVDLKILENKIGLPVSKAAVFFQIIGLLWAAFATFSILGSIGSDFDISKFGGFLFSLAFGGSCFAFGRLHQTIFDIRTILLLKAVNKIDVVSASNEASHA